MPITKSEFVTFKLADDPVEYKLLKDFNKICDAEAETGCNLMRAMLGALTNARELRALLFGCLKTAHPSVLLSEAGDLMDRPDWGVVLTALGKAMGWESVKEVPDVPAIPPAAGENAPG